MLFTIVIGARLCTITIDKAPHGIGEVKALATT
jgi:hypothetical protein